jgi:hypothetical protein
MTLRLRVTPGASVTPIENGWRLQIPAGTADSYRLAQLDDYAALPRSRFPLSAPASLNLRCRVSPPFPPPIFAQSNSASEENKAGRKWGERGGLPGTWGFGFWNDPFMFSFGLQGMARRLPMLPNAAWFFHASAENHLSLRNNLPGSGFLAQSFSSPPKVPSLLFVPGLVVLSFLFSRTFTKWLRAIAGKIINEDCICLSVDATQWHEYRLSWSPNRVEYAVDGESVFETGVSPKGPLGLVIWIDNQFAAFTPEGKVKAGTLENRVPAWMEIANLEI